MDERQKLTSTQTSLESCLYVLVSESEILDLKGDSIKVFIIPL